MVAAYDYRARLGRAKRVNSNDSFRQKVWELSPMQASMVAAYVAAWVDGKRSPTVNELRSVGISPNGYTRKELARKGFLSKAHNGRNWVASCYAISQLAPDSR